MQIIIEKTDEGKLTVWQDGKNCNTVTLGEMLEQVLGLLDFKPPLYPMKTPEEWEAAARKWK